MSGRLRRRGAAPPPRIVHLGLGAFARAHLGDYTEDAGGWGICGVAPRRRRRRRRAAPRRTGRYTLVERGEQDRFRVLGCVGEVLHAPSERAAVLAALAAAEIVTLTVTEKAYRADAPVIALLREGLARRAARRRPCSRSTTCRATARCSRGSSARPGHRFPCSMVDRVVPATTGDRRRCGALASRTAVGRRRAVPAVGDRGLRRPAAGLGRAVRRLQRPARGAQAAAAQRHPLAAGLRSGCVLGRAHVADAWADEDAGRRRAAASPTRISSRRCPRSRASTSATTAPSSRAAGRTRASTTGWRRSRSTATPKLPARFAEPARRVRVPLDRARARGLPRRTAASDAVLDHFPPAVHDLVADWRARFAADGLRRVPHKGSDPLSRPEQP